jgi:hypothetical protein
MWCTEWWTPYSKLRTPYSKLQRVAINGIWPTVVTKENAFINRPRNYVTKAFINRPRNNSQWFHFFRCSKAVNIQMQQKVSENWKKIKCRNGSCACLLKVSKKTHQGRKSFHYYFYEKAISKKSLLRLQMKTRKNSDKIYFLPLSIRDFNQIEIITKQGCQICIVTWYQNPE